MAAPVPVPRPAPIAPEQEAVRAQVAQNPAATLSDLLGAGYSWQEIFAMGRLGHFKTFEDAYANAQKQQPEVTQRYPIETKPQELPQPIAPVRGTNEAGEETITFTAAGMKRFLTLMNPTEDGRLSGIDPNSNIGVTPYAMKAPLTPEQAVQTDPIQNLRVNANATPLPDDVLAQLRMDAQAKQQALGRPRPANPLVR